MSADCSFALLAWSNFEKLCWIFNLKRFFCANLCKKPLDLRCPFMLSNFVWIWTHRSQYYGVHHVVPMVICCERAPLKTRAHHMFLIDRSLPKGWSFLISAQRGPNQWRHPYKRLKLHIFEKVQVRIFENLSKTFLFAIVLFLNTQFGQTLQHFSAELFLAE